MRAVIFDVGRVLVHWDPEATLAGLARVSQMGPGELQPLLHQVSHDLGAGTLSDWGFHRFLIEHAGTTRDWSLFYAAFCNGLCRDEHGLSFASQLAQRDVPLGIISNTNAIHVQWLHDNLPELAGFRSVVWSSNAGLLKPDRAIYQLATGQIGVAPADALFVDDLEENVAGARQAGLAGWVHRDWDETRRVVEDWLSSDKRR